MLKYCYLVEKPWVSQYVGVFDLDSPNLEQFDETDQRGLEQIVKILENECIWDFVQTK